MRKGEEMYKVTDKSRIPSRLDLDGQMRGIETMPTENQRRMEAACTSRICARTGLGEPCMQW